MPGIAILPFCIMRNDTVVRSCQSVQVDLSLLLLTEDEPGKAGPMKCQRLATQRAR